MTLAFAMMPEVIELNRFAVSLNFRQVREVKGSEEEEIFSEGAFSWILFSSA